MDSQRWERIQTLFHDAVELPASERHAFLKTACGDDNALMAQVLAMLDEDARGGSLLDGDLTQVAKEVLSTATAAPLKEFGAYRVLRVLGEGGMGVVYLAERKDLGTQVAIKVLRDAWLSPARRERFASEQRMLAQLTHPTIARLYDAETLPDGTPWFVMEYVDGVSLTEYCRKHESSIEARLRLFRSVCEAVQYAHGHAVIHRDLKPSNILVNTDGTIRLLDFGIAKQLESMDEPVDQTMTGLRLMTPAYAAPEQIRGDRVGVHTDVYSLGVILYELLALQLPFDLSNLTPAEAATIVVDHEPAKPSVALRRLAANDSATSRPLLNKTAWADLDVLCLTAMHKDPQRRYRSVEALMRDIDHYLKGEPLEARADNWGYRLGKFVRRNERAVSLTAMVLVVIISLVVFFTVRITKARNQALAEAARTARIQHFMMNLFQGGDEAVGPSDSLRVVTLVDRGVQEAKTLNNDPKVQAELYLSLGTIYQQLGKFEQADSLLRSSLDERKSLFGADSTEAAESLIALGLLRDAEGQYEAAEHMVRDGLEVDKRKLPANHPAVAKATGSLGRVLEDRGNYDQAIKVLDEAVRLQSAPGGPSIDLAESLTELANSHFYSGHYDVSDSLNRRVLSMDRQLYGERHPHVADDLINLGAIQQELGHFAEAETFDRQALDITRSFYGENHPETASALTILGRALVSQNKNDEAVGMLQQALAIQEKVYGKVHPRVASTLNELGRIAQQQGKLDDAEADFSRMAEIYRTVYAGNHYYIGVALCNLAGVYVEKKQYDRAVALFREGLRIYAETLSPGHQNIGVARVRLGHALVLQRRFSEAEQESLPGYEILAKQPSPPARWRQTAITDLATIYAALKQPDKAAQFESEMAKGRSEVIASVSGAK
jgi:serine/threonine-protein kinase